MRSAVQAKLLQSTVVITGPTGPALSALLSFLVIHHCCGNVMPVARQRVTVAWENAVNQDVVNGSATLACVSTLWHAFGPRGGASSAGRNFLMIHLRGNVMPVARQCVTLAWQCAMNQNVDNGSAAIACIVTLASARRTDDCYRVKRSMTLYA